MTTPTHWCPVPDTSIGLHGPLVDIYTQETCPSTVFVSTFLGRSSLSRTETEQLRDHLTELLKHMPEDNR